MKAQSTCVPRLEKLEDRSIPGSLLGLADPSIDLFADLFESAGDSTPFGRALADWSESPKAERVPAALPVALAPSNPIQAPVQSGARLIPVGNAAAAKDELGPVMAALVRSAGAGGSGALHSHSGVNRVQIRHDSESSAFAFYHRTEGCITTEITLVAHIGTTRSWPPQETDGPSALHGVVVFINDDCKDQPLIDAEGFSNDLGMARVAPDLRSATLSGTFHSLNVTNGRLIDFNVSVAWVAAGKPVSETTVNRFDSSLEIIHSLERPAIASGTVFVGTKNYLHGPTADATIQAVQSLEVTR